MLRFSFPLGRIMGVEVRLHLSFFLLFLCALAYGQAYNNAWRGAGLFAALALAVAVRETARCIAAAYVGLRLRALFLLPVGGVMAFAPPDSGIDPGALPMVLTAPLANIGMGLLLLGLSYAIAPKANLLTQPWISPEHVLRTFVWMQFVLAIVNLLPTATLPTRQLLRLGQRGAGNAPKIAAPTTGNAGPAFGLIAALGVMMVLTGLLTSNLFAALLGCFALLASQLTTPQTSTQTSPATDAPVGDGMRVDEVMLTEFTLISNSDTLRGALDRTVHSLQDAFPVVRGNRLVGSITRQTLAEQLMLEGDSYVQGAMNRNLQVAAPREQWMAVFGRVRGQSASEFIPVAEDGRLLGILTPQNLSRAVNQVRHTRLPAEPRVPRD
ncbi:MAG TPA: CBS domain-containing protein [Acidobacteriaceae bacterium]